MVVSISYFSGLAFGEGILVVWVSNLLPLQIIINFKLHYLNLQCIGIHENDLARLFELGNCNDSDGLSNWPCNDSCLEFGLISHEKYMWCLIHDKRIFVLVWVRP